MTVGIEERRWVDTGVHGLQARHDNGLVHIRTAGGVRTIDVPSLRRLAQASGAGAWTPALARTVLTRPGL
ncbi:hypothetical protein ABZ951_30295 [Streptomyces sp. NPDC046215]|uniref:Uncharacterized protein n=1 Tax=Streptomyces stramineus TaxID=173861 RepID=A0ABN1B2Y9_9ACTN